MKLLTSNVIKDILGAPLDVSHTTKKRTARACRSSRRWASRGSLWEGRAKRRRLCSDRVKEEQSKRKRKEERGCFSFLLFLSLSPSLPSSLTSTHTHTRIHSTHTTHTHTHTSLSTVLKNHFCNSLEGAFSPLRIDQPLPSPPPLPSLPHARQYAKMTKLTADAKYGEQRKAHRRERERERSAREKGSRLCPLHLSLVSSACDCVARRPCTRRTALHAAPLRRSRRPPKAPGEPAIMMSPFASCLTHTHAQLSHTHNTHMANQPAAMAAAASPAPSLLRRPGRP